MVEISILRYVGETVGLINEAYRQFIASKSEGGAFLGPFLLCVQEGVPVMVEMGAFTEEHINATLASLDVPVSGFVLAGESVILNPQTNKGQHFFVAKLVVDGLEHSYVYSLPFNTSDPVSQLLKVPLRFVGCEPNAFFPFHPLKGEESSCNAIKMDNEAPYDYRAAFLIGHLDEARLWSDAKRFISDTYCKLAFDTAHRYDIVFEVSKFGKMTETMQEEYSRVNRYFEQQFAPLFSHVRGAVRLENTPSSVHPN